MLIQVVANYRNIIVPPVTLVTAGDDLFPVCDVSITLTAIVIPVINLPSHTILWEQMGGTPVILSNTDQLTTSYTRLSNDKTDKIFKITIDKDEPDEQSDIIIVYSTPSSFLYGSYGKSQTNVFTPSDPVPCDSIIADTSASVLPPEGGIKDVVPDAAFDISWDLPADPILAPWLVDMNVFENGSSVGSPYLPSDTLVYDAVLTSPTDRLYYIRSNFLVNGQPSSANSCVEDFSDEIPSKARAIDDMITGLGFAKPDVKLTKFSNTKRNVDTFQISGYSMSDAKISRFINKTINAEIDKNGIGPEDTFQISGFSASDTLITRTDPGGIGGG